MALGGNTSGFEGLFARDTAARPPFAWLAREALAVIRRSAEILDAAQLRALPAGDGHPVLLLPAFLHGESSIRPMQGLLQQLGYAAAGWGCGINLGPTTQVMEQLARRIRSVHLRSGRRVSLVGHSMGGIFAREFAKRQPDDVRAVVTICSPFRPPLSTHVEPLFRLTAFMHAPDVADLWPRLGDPPPVPTLAIYSREDGIVDWRCCTEADPDDDHRTAEIRGCHSTAASNAEVIRLIAGFLAEPERRLTAR